MTIEEQVTGCRGAHSYKDYARERGYMHVEVLNWGSSAGDWQFLVSRDGHEWQILFQENNYPRAGFSHSIEPRVYYGALDDVSKEIEEEWR